MCRVPGCGTLEWRVYMKEDYRTKHKDCPIPAELILPEEQERLLRDLDHFLTHSEFIKSKDKKKKKKKVGKNKKRQLALQDKKK